MREHIVKALRQSNGRISGKNGAAEILGVNSNTLYSKMKKLGVFTR
nr:helix-turn-helix domain-containing protein [Hafnia alvei]